MEIVRSNNLQYTITSDSCESFRDALKVFSVAGEVMHWEIVCEFS